MTQVTGDLGTDFDAIMDTGDTSGALNPEFENEVASELEHGNLDAADIVEGASEAAAFGDQNAETFVSDVAAITAADGQDIGDLLDSAEGGVALADDLDADDSDYEDEDESLADVLAELDDC